jgi:hypothetical protein
LPTRDQVVSDTLPIHAVAYSAYPISGIVASVGSQQLALTYVGRGGWGGRMLLAGTYYGTFQLVLTATRLGLIRRNSCARKSCWEAVDQRPARSSSCPPLRSRSRELLRDRLASSHRKQRPDAVVAPRPRRTGADSFSRLGPLGTVLRPHEDDAAEACAAR